MEKIIKVIMYIFRENNRKEFFILHRKKGDTVTLTGHVEQESLEQAARREAEEELGVKPLEVLNLKMKTDVIIDGILSQEHAFLIKIPNKDVHFLEGDEIHKWYSVDELYQVLTYPNQKEPLDKIKEIV